MIIDRLTGADVSVIISAIDLAIEASKGRSRRINELLTAKHRVLCAKSEEEEVYNPEKSGGVVE
jgi:hypothetical protein